MNLVLDSSAVIAYLRREDGGIKVNEFITDENNTCFVHAANICEVYYDTVRTVGSEMAGATIDALQDAGVIIREDMDLPFWQAAGSYKADLRIISLADCFCLALANRLDCSLVTSDHHEFDAVVDRGLCRIEFIR